MSNFTCQSKSFISIFFICQVSACELRPFSCYNLANDIYSQTAKTVFSHLNDNDKNDIAQGGPRVDVGIRFPLKAFLGLAPPYFRH